MGQCKETDQGIIVLLNEGHGFKSNYWILAGENSPVVGRGITSSSKQNKIIYVCIKWIIMFSSDLELAYCLRLNKQKRVCYYLILAAMNDV